MRNINLSKNIEIRKNILILITFISPWKLVSAQVCEEDWVTLLHTMLDIFNSVEKVYRVRKFNKTYLVKLVPDLRHIDLPNSVTTWYLPVKSSGT